MTYLDPQTAYQQHLKKQTFSKSWQNSFVNKTKKILNRETGQFEAKELDVFVFLPAPSLVRFYGSDKEFMQFRNDNKFEKDWDYKLLDDAAENNNRRLAIKYFARALDALEINFTIDDSYTLYILEDELKRLGESSTAEQKEFYNSLFIPKTLAKRQGATETWN